MGRYDEARSETRASNNSGSAVECFCNALLPRDHFRVVATAAAGLQTFFTDAKFLKATTVSPFAAT
jgi:hypothetical protein